MKLLTIFTPTYNRAKTLEGCYQSLLDQTSMNFLWQIVDDGSTDNTRQLVEQFINEGLIQIEYYYKENGGKVSAINYSMKKTSTPLWVCLDSDDYLTKSAVKCIEDLYPKIKGRTDLCGLFGLRFNPDLTPMHGKSIPADIKEATQLEIRYKYGIEPEYIQVYKTEIAKQYRYPLFEGEKFMPLSYVQDQIDQKYKFLIFQEALMICTYLTDGITKNHAKIVKNNPHGYTEFKRQQIEYSPSFLFKVKACITYDTGCILSKNISAIFQSPCRFGTIVLFPVACMDYFVRYRNVD